MAHVEDRWTVPTGELDSRGRVVREHGPRWGIGQRWMANWTEGGRRRSQMFETKDAAVAHVGKIKKAQAEGRHVNAHKVTVAEFGDDWITTQLHQRPRTQATVSSRWTVQIRPALGHLLLTEVTPMHIQRAVLNWRDDGMAPTGIRSTYGYIASIFKAAVRARLIVDNPCQDINLPRDEREKVIPLTTAQVHQIADQVEPRFRSLILLGAATGMRSSELVGLTPDRLRWGDFLNIRVDRQLATITPTWGPPKTPASDRTVSVDDTAAGMLQYHLLRYPAGPQGIIFTGRNGGPLGKGTISSFWRAAIEGMGLPPRSGLHALRHYHASLLIAAGVSVTAVAERLGHEDTSTTLRIYSHLWPNDEQRSREAIASGLWA